MIACPTQMPPSFAERMIYELINEELEDSLEAIHFETVQKSGRVAIRKLPMKRNLEKTKEEFKKNIFVKDLIFMIPNLISKNLSKKEFHD